MAQRVRALEAFLADVHRAQRAVADGAVPHSLISSSTHVHPAARGIEPPNGARVQVAGIDPVRDEAGDFRVLEDNVRVPSGDSCVLSNRRAMARTFPELFAALRIRPVSGYPRRLLAALTAAARPGVDDPTVVVLTPGVFNSDSFEHSLLARTMAVELVEGRDLFCSAGRVWMRTIQGWRRVDVIDRRVDDEHLDPVAFRQDSLLGSPGLLTCARLGTVPIANAVGNGVADDTLVVKPVDGSGGKGLVIGPAASAAELDRLRGRLRRDPRDWIAQPVVQLSTVPTLVEDVLRPRHVDLHPFAVNDGETVWVLPGGLTRVALPQGELVVNSSQGGGSKDTWVLGGVPPTRSGRVAEHPQAVPVGSSVPIDANPDDLRAQSMQQQTSRPTAPSSSRDGRAVAPC